MAVGGSVEGPAIVCAGLTKRYGSVLALDGLDLTVPRGSLFGFLGPNGAGKTTLIRVLLGLAAPTGGAARVLGHDVVTGSLEIRRRVGYLPQQPRFHAELTARELLRYARGFFPRGPDARVEEDITEVLDLVGLAAKGDSRVGELSGGQQQRLGIAQAQIHRPELLVLDEPASALDPLGRRDVLAVMRRLRRTTTVFFSTHILDDVQRVADEVVIVRAGHRVLQSGLDELLSSGQGDCVRLTLEGDVAAAMSRLRRLDRVREVDARPGDGTVEVTVRVVEPRAARRDLLRAVLSCDGVDVVEFGRPRSALEDVFVDVVGGGRP